VSDREGGPDYDLALLGGGLANGLIALALAVRRPDHRIVLIERDRVGGEHIWSHFAADVDRADDWLVEPLIAHRWPAYDVAFPSYRRTLTAEYRSITSERLADVLANRLPPGAFLRGEVTAASPTEVVLADGRRLSVGAVIDARGPGDLGTLDLGWQKFVGQTLRVPRHGVERPVVMDATVPQHDGYRFVYLLPLGDDEIFVEDTYYSDIPDLDAPGLARRIAAYAAMRGWPAGEVIRSERGVLPVVVAGDFAAYWASTGHDLAKAGMRAGLFHPTTGYSLPDAIHLAGRIAAAPDLSHDALVRLTADHASRLWSQRGFYRTLDTMLFRAAEPGQRYRVLERFYRLDPGLVSRFYRGSSTRADQVRILSGRPPVPVGRAVKALLARASAR